MKTLIFALLFALTAMGQTRPAPFLEPYKEGSVVMLFYTYVPDGLDNAVDLKFQVGAFDLEEIKDSEMFKYWNKEKRGAILDPTIEYFLDWVITNESVYTMSGLERTCSYMPLSETTGLIFLNDNGEVGVNFILKAQNEFGNYIFGKSIYSMGIKDGKEEIINYVFFD